MPFTGSFNMEQVTDIADVKDRLLDLHNARPITRGQDRPTTDGFDAVASEIPGEFEAYLQGITWERDLRGQNLKPIVHAWV